MKQKISALLAIIMFICSFSAFGSGAFAAGAVSITTITQRPFIIDDGGQLKSETQLTISNPGVALSAWVKISVTGKSPYLQSIGNLVAGTSTTIVNVLELDNDGDNVTFEVFDNADGTGVPVATKTSTQKKIRHWKFFIAHDTHMDYGYTNPQESLRKSIFPGFLDDASTKIAQTAGQTANNQFRYPLEASYMFLESAANARNADWLETYKQNVRNGNISYPSNFQHSVYEGLGTEQLARENYYSERISKDMLGADSSKVLVKSDDSSISWANIDANASAGVKYGVIRANWTNSTWSDSNDNNYAAAYPRLFYMQGRVPTNKILFYNHGKYSMDDFSFRNTDVSGNATFNAVAGSLLNLQNNVTDPTSPSSYPYDAVFEDMTNGGDNGGIVADVIRNIQTMNAKTDSLGRKYVFPEYRSSNVGDFFQYIDANADTSKIPTFKGTLEGSWNYGAASAAFETSVNKQNHDKLPAAEKFATWATLAGSGTRYPFENINEAFKKMTIFDDHAWGPQAPSNNRPEDQWNWKRDMAITGNTLSDSTLNSSLGAINALIPTNGKTIVVYNSNSWINSDIVNVKASDLPVHFDLIDKETGLPVPYQRLSDGNVAFVAGNVPGNGYKTFQVNTRADDPVFTTSLVATANTLENNYFKVTFDSTGSISSIIDKANGNKEMVDSTAPNKMNQFIYYTTNANASTLLTTNSVISAQLTSAVGGVMGVMTADGKPAQGVSNLKRNVILYDSLPRIDIVNDVMKDVAMNTAAQDEEAYFSFPMNVSTPLIRHEMPTGDVRPGVSSNTKDTSTEQLYGSMTDNYTVNRWIDVSNQSDYGIMLSPVNAPLVEYGARRSYQWDKNYDVRQQKPWIYSYVFNNKWQTNFQKTQGGLVSFKYSIASHGGADWKTGRADKFGMQAASGFTSTVIQNAQSGTYNGKVDQLIGIDQNNVVLTAAKIAENNGEGVILRFNETLGADTTVTVDLGKLQAGSATQTDIVENDLAPLQVIDNKVTFTIKGHDWFTIRVTQGTAPVKVSGVAATMDSKGTQLTWNEATDSKLAYYEIFRSKDSNFTPGSGSYIASASSNHYYDTQVMTGLTNTYYYKVRAVRAGGKGSFSDAATPAAGTIADTQAPSTPVLNLDYALADRITVHWTKSTDNVLVAGYKVYRDGTQISDSPAQLNSYLDNIVLPGDHLYTVKAYDQNGNLTPASNAIAVTGAPSSLVAQWSMNEGSETIVNDTSGNSNNGTMLNNPTWSNDGITGKALSFNGTNSRVEFGSTPSLNLTDAITVSVWFKTSQSASVGGVKSIIRHDGHFTALQFDGTGKGRITYWINGVPKTVTFTWSNTAWSDNEWHHYAVTYNKASGMLVYIDGVQRASNTTNLGALSTTSTSFMLGANETGGEAFNGLLDDVRVFSEALTSDKIVALSTEHTSSSVNQSFNKKDGFENGLSNWKVVTGKGVPTLSTKIKHSGSYSYVLNEDVDAIIQNLDKQYNKVFKIWFYDSAVLNNSPTKQNKVFVDDGLALRAIGVNTPTSPTKYAYRIGSSYFASNVTRTLGWHEFKWDYTSGDHVDMYVDNILIISESMDSNGNGKSFNRIVIGDQWGNSGAAPSTVTYYDDLSISENDTTSVALDKEALSIGYANGDGADGVTRNVTLNTTGANDSTITWSSDTIGVISASGTVIRPLTSATDAIVSLTATITKGTETATKTFVLYVLAAEEGSERAMLQAMIALAQSAHAHAVEGTDLGQYPIGSRDTLMAAIQAASIVNLDAASTQQQLDHAAISLNIALQSFTQSIILTTLPVDPGDLDGNGQVNIGDLILAGHCYGMTEVDSGWLSAKPADVNNDGKIDIADLVWIANRILQ